MKLLYASHIDYGWIKQRPQFLAEKLSDSCEIVYLYKRTLGKKYNNNSSETSFLLIPVIQLPLTRFSIVRKINQKLYCLSVKRTLKSKKCDVLWTSDYELSQISNINIPVIYEMMDIYSEMTNNAKLKKHILKSEKIMFDSAASIVVSSEYIKGYIIKKYGVNEERIHLIRNGFSSDKDIIIDNNNASHGRIIKLAYFGTVASWFDWETIKFSLKENNDIEYHIIGPTPEGVPENIGDKVFFYGAVKHDELYSLIKDCDALIMPFIVNEIIKGVDPVKLYEYIYFKKNIICVKYQEIIRFEKFVYFYNNKEEYIEAINEVKKGKLKYNEKDAMSFLSDNTWDNRAKVALQICEAVIHHNKE